MEFRLVRGAKPKSLTAIDVGKNILNLKAETLVKLGELVDSSYNIRDRKLYPSQI